MSNFKSFLTMLHDKECIFIRETSLKYDFYPEDIFHYLLACKNIVKMNYKGSKINLKYKIFEGDGEKVGFSIYGIYPDKSIHVFYHFILPDYRRKGYSEKFIKSLKYKTNEINVESSSKSMIHLLNKLDFKFKRKCLNNTDLWFQWSK